MASELIDLIRDLNVFDLDSYSKQTGTNFLNYEEAFEHFSLEGARNLADPHILFMTRWYIDSSPDVAHAQINPLGHYLRYGANELRSPHPCYSPKYVASQLPPNADVPSIFDFITDKSYRKIDPHPLFDTAFYLIAAGQKLSGEQHPLVHFITTGRHAELSPHPLFDPIWYANHYNDVNVGDALVHFLRYGLNELRDPSPLFSSIWYAGRYPGRYPDKLAPILHYLTQRDQSELQPHALFDPLYWGGRRKGDARSPARLYIDYLSDIKDLEPSRIFKPSWYQAANPESSVHYGSMLSHYLYVGVKQGNGCNPYGKFLYTSGPKASMAFGDDVLIVGGIVYRYEETLNYRILEDAISPLADLDLELKVVGDILSAGMRFNTSVFDNVLLRETVRLISAVYSFEILCVTLKAQTNESLKGLLLSMQFVLGRDAQDHQSIYLLGLDPRDRAIPASFKDRLHGSDLDRSATTGDAHYTTEVVKSVLVSVKFSRVFIVVDPMTLHLMHRYGSQLSAMGSIVLVVQEFEDDASIAALIELLQRFWGAFSVIAIAGARSTKEIMRRFEGHASYPDNLFII